jgi:hypothetical protein
MQRNVFACSAFRNDRHKDRLYQGMHPAIIDEALWESVQDLPHMVDAFAAT